jgi:RNA polymerase sigma-70 factor, ECF subfamily
VSQLESAGEGLAPRPVVPDGALADSEMAASALADAMLLRAVASGDQEALAALYDRHAGWLLARLKRRCAVPDLVDQALQDTFLTVWRRAATYRGDGAVTAFLWGIAVRRLIDSMRAGSKADRAWFALRDAAADQLVRSAEDEVLKGVEHGRLGAALNQLSPELRAAIEATVLDGLSCAEAGVLLGVPTGTVKSRCHRARIELRRVLT